MKVEHERLVWSLGRRGSLRFCPGFASHGLLGGRIPGVRVDVCGDGVRVEIQFPGDGVENRSLFRQFSFEGFDAFARLVDGRADVLYLFSRSSLSRFVRLLLGHVGQFLHFLGRASQSHTGAFDAGLVAVSTSS